MRIAPTASRNVCLLVLLCLSVLLLPACTSRSEIDDSALPQAADEASASATDESYPPASASLPGRSIAHADSNALQTASIPAESDDLATMDAEQFASNAQTDGEFGEEEGDAEHADPAEDSPPASPEPSDAISVDGEHEEANVSEVSSAEGRPEADGLAGESELHSPERSDEMTEVAASESESAEAAEEISLSQLGELATTSTDQTLLPAPGVLPSSAGEASVQTPSVESGCSDGSQASGTNAPDAGLRDDCVSLEELKSPTTMLQTLKGAFSGCCGDIGIRLTIGDFNGSGASGRFVTSIAGAKDCDVTVEGRRLLLVLDDASELELVITSPETLRFSNNRCVLRKE